MFGSNSHLRGRGRFGRDRFFFLFFFDMPYIPCSMGYILGEGAEQLLRLLAAELFRLAT